MSLDLLDLLDLRGATTRRILLVALALSALAGASGRATAQVTTSSSSTSRTRSGGGPRDSVRVRRERLLIRFDSLRNLFEHERLSAPERQALGDEMHETMMALQESMNEMTVRVRTMTPAFPQEAMPGQTMVFKRRDATRGYLGVSFDGPNVDELRGTERIIRFLDYPRIALVEPSSPAERAGIVEGDTLLELNGSDVRDRAFSLTKLLVPRERVRLRVRRDGSPMDFRVTIVEAPGYMVSRMTPLPPMAPVPGTPEPSPRVRVYVGDVPQPAPPSPAAVAATPAPVAMAWMIQDGVAGARLESVTEGLGRALGTQYGVLVLRSAPGSPAFDSGLRDGDVILKVDRGSVRSVRDLREAIQDADGDDGVKLVVLRDKRQREITLRW